MTMQTIQQGTHIWQISRRFDGSKDAEALVRALIQAHRT